MEIRHPESLSAEVLVGIVNEKLRLNCKDKAALLYDLGMDEPALDAKLHSFIYDAKCNQYRSK
ncbi:DUF4250 family protein [Shewanella sp. JM162201]|uniref:DUF4250 family protein n=1 Tax=Shewanella jiangmenensis TaxID=2837387 RepID=A0ABS5V7P7_9GAMM|nr:DUF4250 family protein [Shewanella jiangmenensis]MBT1446451.1 DUF4250 family protein [Shewanella jiangmenensis]